jgi:hypothetical protein
MPARRRNDHQPRRDPIAEAIRSRAFELFLARGSEHGHDLDDWLQAEQEFHEAARRLQQRSTAALHAGRRLEPNVSETSPQPEGI